MIRRKIEGELRILAQEYPVVTILGPRQAGKTTLAQMVFPEFEYSNLEVPEVRERAQSDPKAYLAQFVDSVILDEIQQVPDLLSYIQGIVDEEDRCGRFILTGSHQLRVREAVSQSLAGRTALLNLLPLSIAELMEAGSDIGSFEEISFRGFLPRVHVKSLRPVAAYSNYYQTYVERDVRQLIHLKNVTLFEKLLKLMAGRVGQLVDYGSLANDVGVDSKTIQNWLSILEASFVLFKLPAYFENFGKRVIKAPKYYFTEMGLLCFLLGIRKPEQITRDPLVGSIFENLIVVECLKSRCNQGMLPDLYYFRDSNGNEVDVVAQRGRVLDAIEIKSASTFSSSNLKGLHVFKRVASKVDRSYLVYNGEPFSLSNQIDVLHYTGVDQIFLPRNI